MRGLKKQKLRKLKGGGKSKTTVPRYVSTFKPRGRNVAQKHILLHAMKMLYTLLVIPIRRLNMQKIRKLKRGK
jgi:hypothetical protein